MEALGGATVLQNGMKELKTSFLLDEEPLSLEVVGSQEATESSKDGLFVLSLCFLEILLHHVKCSGFGCEFLHFGVVLDSLTESLAADLPCTWVRVGQDELQEVLHASTHAQV